MGKKRFEIDEPAALQMLLDEVQAQALERHGIRVTKVVFEADDDIEDVTEILTAVSESPEHRLLRRRAALGDIVAGIAHQSRNIMTGVLSFSELARQRNQQEKLTKLLDNIGSESLRCVTLLNQVLILARSRDAAGHGQFEACSLPMILISARNLVLPRMQSKGIDFESRIESTLPDIMGDPMALRDVFVNLLQNAVDATPAGGHIQVHAQLEGNGLRVIFDDDGTGVQPEYRNKVFMPSFTTKRAGKGTGLGLAVSHQIISEHGGDLAVRESPAGGARFVATLPILKKASE